MKLSSGQLMALQVAVNMVKLEGDGGPLKKSDALKKAEASAEDNVSLGSNDLPKMFATAPKEQAKQEPSRSPKRATQQTKSFMSRTEGSLTEIKVAGPLGQAMGFAGAKPCKRPASLEAVENALGKGLPLAKGERPKAFAKGQSPKTLARGKSQKTLAKGKGDGPYWYNVRKASAKNPKRTDLAGCLEEGPGKQRKLIVESSTKWGTK